MNANHAPTGNTWQALGDLADRLRRLRPDHRDPERFHVEKSEIEHELRRLAAVAGPSRPTPPRVIRTPTHG